MAEDQGYDLSRFKTTYFEECSELLGSAEETIARLQQGGGSDEDLNAVFRCVHSIKGGAGAFAFDGLVHYAHVLETSLDALRSGRAQLTAHVADLLVRGNDILGDYVRAAQDGVDLPSDHGHELMTQLAAATGGTTAKPAGAKTPVAPVAAAVSAGMKTWQIALLPTSGLLRTGNDPLLMIRELASLGEIKVDVDLSRLPSLGEMDSQATYLSWIITLQTDKPLSAIDEVFEFVAGDVATVTIDEISQSGAEADALEGEGWGLFAPPPAAAGPAAPVEPVLAQAAANSAIANGQAGQIHTASIRVDLDKVDRLVNMVGELVITQAMLGQQTTHFSVESHPELIQGLQELSHHTRELQESVMAIRAQPVKALFSRAPRLVRDLSSKLGRQVRLVMHGENTEVDKTVIEQLSDPLTHLIRNCVDHGIESPEERISVGKPAEGTIRLGAEHRSGRIIIEVSDDGRGINRKRVLEKAVEKGLIERGAQLTDEQIDAMIFAPGFSTAAEVSDVSGRGVGMDVVRKNIQDVGGRVVVQSTPGHGSRFILSLPLTLAVMDGMLVQIGAQRFVLPLTNIVESLRPTPQQARSLVNVGNVLVLRGEYIRLIPLHQLFTIPGAITDPTRGLVVVVETEGGDRIGLLVDELLGQQQVVIKSLDANFRPVNGISAATILGDGRVALILDVGALRAMGETLPSPGTMTAALTLAQAAE
jgi:two-component system, chemotaxis family, sensor kinase CheA